MNPSTSGYHQQHQQPMTHHLVEPKFAPEDYQTNYVASTASEYFGGAHPLNHPQPQLQYGYHQHHHQATSTPYGTSAAVQLNGGYPGYGSYYAPHHPHQVHAVHHPSLHPQHHLAMPPEAQQPPLTCPTSMQNQHQQQSPVQASTGLGSTALSPSILQNHGVQEQMTQHHQLNPTQSQNQTQQLESGVCSPAGSTIHRDNSPELQQQRHQHSHLHQNETGSDQDDLDEDQIMEGSPDMMDEEDEDEENGGRVVYAWMKKVHVAGVGKMIFFIFLLYLIILKI